MRRTILIIPILASLALPALAQAAPEYREPPCEPGFSQALSGASRCLQNEPHATFIGEQVTCFGWGFGVNALETGEDTGQIQAKNLELSSGEPERLTFTITDNSEPTYIGGSTDHTQRFGIYYWPVGQPMTAGAHFTNAIPANSVPLPKGTKLADTIPIAPGRYEASAIDLEEWPSQKCKQQVTSMLATEGNGKAVTVG